MFMRNYCLLFLLFLLQSIHSFSQISLNWAKRMGGGGTEFGHDVTIDVKGNVYTTGFFRLTADFDPGADTFNLTAASDDAFVSKLDASGNFVWARRMGGTGPTWGQAIEIDKLGNVYTAGLFYETGDFDPGPSIYSLNSLGITDIFISKLDSSGNFIWAKRIGGIYIEDVHSMEIDPFGNIYITGTFGSTVDFNPGPGVNNLIATGASNNSYVLKLNTHGDFVWVKGILGMYTAEGMAITVDENENVYCTGSFEGTKDFDPGMGIYNLTALGSFDTYVLKLNNLGDFVWAHQFGAAGNDQAYSIVTDNGSVYSSGNFQDTADFDPGAGVYTLVAPPGFGHSYVSKLDATGNFVWAKSFGGQFNYGKNNSLAVNTNGDVYNLGNFQGTIDVDPGAGTHNITSSGGIEIYLLKLNASGDFVWAGTMGSSTFSEAPCAITIDSIGGIYGTGMFNDISDFDPGPGTYNLASAGWPDIFVMKLCENSMANDDIIGQDTICVGGNYNYGIPPVFGANSYTWTLPSGWAGSSSSNSISVTPNSSSGTISVIANGSCGIASSGSKSVHVLLCIGLEDNNTSTVKIFPNPTEGFISVSGLAPELYDYSITNVVGQTIKMGILGIDGNIDISMLATGSYYLKINDQIWKIIKN